MSKHFYFGATVFFILSVYVIEAMGVDVKSLLLVGFSFVLSLVGMILNELYEQRTRGEAFQNQVRGRLEEISFEMQVMRDCRFDQMQERTRELVKTLEVLGKLTEAKEVKKEDKPTADDEKPSEVIGKNKR